jgi:hypothetical protein
MERTRLWSMMMRRYVSFEETTTAEAFQITQIISYFGT